MSEVNDQPTNEAPTAEEIILDMPYWSRPEFHQALQSVPFKQQDGGGNTIANVHDHFFKVVQGQLVMARVPENLGIPEAWEPVPDDHQWRDKAVSLLGLNI
jgi:hypothetical protein